jgi:hypothetical protein
MHSLQLAALDTLQHRLPGDAQPKSRLEHREIPGRRLLDEAGPELIGEADPPRRTGRELLADEEAVQEPAMNGGRRDTEQPAA